MYKVCLQFFEDISVFFQFHKEINLEKLLYSENIEFISPPEISLSLFSRLPYKQQTDVSYAYTIYLYSTSVF